MKKDYVKPAMDCEVFAANEFVANCGYCPAVSYANSYFGPDGVRQYGCGSKIKADFTMSDGQVIDAKTVEEYDTPSFAAGYADNGYHKVTSITTALS